MKKQCDYIIDAVQHSTIYMTLFELFLHRHTDTIGTRKVIKFQWNVTRTKDSVWVVLHNGTQVHRDANQSADKHDTLND